MRWYATMTVLVADDHQYWCAWLFWIHNLHMVLSNGYHNCVSWKGWEYKTHADLGVIIWIHTSYDPALYDAVSAEFLCRSCEPAAVKKSFEHENPNRCGCHFVMRLYSGKRNSVTNAYLSHSRNHLVACISIRRLLCEPKNSSVYQSTIVIAQATFLLLINSIHFSQSLPCCGRSGWSQQCVLPYLLLPWNWLPPRQYGYF